MTTLFDPIKLGALDLPNRIFMAPLTRSRATDQGRVPTDLVREYYMQRASAGLIVTEATSVDAMGVGYERTPGIWSDEQVEGWKRITQGVHSVGGHIVLQLWHVGRISDPSLLEGRPPVAPSAIPAPGNVSLLRPERPYPVPRALLTEEIAGVVEQFRHGAQNAHRPALTALRFTAPMVIYSTSSFRIFRISAMISTVDRSKTAPGCTLK